MLFRSESDGICSEDCANDGDRKSSRRLEMFIRGSPDREPHVSDDLCDDDEGEENETDEDVHEDAVSTASTTDRKSVV